MEKENEPQRYRELREDAELKARMLDAAIDAIVVRDYDEGLKGKFFYANEAACKMFGYTREEFSGLIMADLSPFTTPEEREAKRRHVLETGKNDLEVIFRRKEGVLFPAETHSSLLTIDGRRLILTTVWDISDRRLAEEELKLRATLLDAASDAIFLRRVNHNGPEKIVYANAAACRLYGYQREEIVGRSFLEFVVPERLAVFGVNRAKMLSEGELRLETEHLRKDGTRVPVEIFATQVKTTGGEYVLTVVRDITRRKQIEEALRESEVKYRNIVETAYEGIMVTDTDRRFLFVNERMAAMLGYTPAALIGRMAADFLTESSREQAAKSSRQLREGGRIQVERSYNRKDGTLLWTLASIAPRFDANGQYLGNLGMHTDITERKRIEEEFRAASRYARRLIEASLDPIIIIDSEGKIEDVNKATEMATGIPREKLADTDFCDYFTEPARAREVYQSVFARGTVTDYPLTIRHVSGRITDVMYNAAVYRDDDGEVLGVIATARDVTALNKAAEALKMFPVRLIEAQEKERRAIGRELHDQTGQYLTALKLLLQKLALDYPLAEASLKDAVGLTGEVLTQVRELSMTLRPPMIDELGLLPSLIWQFERLSKQTELKVNFTHTGIEEGILPADVNMTAFRIIQEALTNVIRHSGVKEAAVSVVATKKKIEITVSDAGRGFDQRNLLRGSSNGLPVMRERAALLGGRLTVTSATGKGTTVSTDLPITPGKRTSKKKAV